MLTTPTTVDGLNLRRVMGRDTWHVPRRYGLDGWAMVARDGSASVIVSTAMHDDGREWIHASIAHNHRTPTYDDLTQLHRAAFGNDRWAYQVFAPCAAHVNIHPHALHLWGRVDGRPALPNFGAQGSI